MSVFEAADTMSLNVDTGWDPSPTTATSPCGGGGEWDQPRAAHVLKEKLHDRGFDFPCCGQCDDDNSPPSIHHEVLPQDPFLHHEMLPHDPFPGTRAGGDPWTDIPYGTPDVGEQEKVTCKCCVDDVDLENSKVPEVDVSKDGKSAETPLTVIAKLSKLGKPGGKLCECKLKWFEKNSAGINHPPDEIWDRLVKKALKENPKGDKTKIRRELVDKWHEAMPISNNYGSNDYFAGMQAIGAEGEVSTFEDWLKKRKLCKKQDVKFKDRPRRTLDPKSQLTATMERTFNIIVYSCDKHDKALGKCPNKFCMLVFRIVLDIKKGVIQKPGPGKLETGVKFYKKRCEKNK